MVVSSRWLRIKLQHLNNSISNPLAPNMTGAEVMTFSDRAVCWFGQLENCVYVCAGILQAGGKSWKQKLVNITKEQKPHLTTKVFSVENVHNTCLLLSRTKKVPSYGWIRTSSPQPPIQAHQPKAAGAMERAQAWNICFCKLAVWPWVSHKLSGFYLIISKRRHWTGFKVL